MEIKNIISCWGAMICSTVWSSSQSRYGTVFAGLWLAAAVIFFIADVIKRSGKYVRGRRGDKTSPTK